MVKNPPASAGDKVQSLGWEDPLKKEMATHSGILAWEIPQREEPSRLHSMESQRVRYDLVTKQQQQTCFKALRYNIILLQNLRV